MIAVTLQDKTVSFHAAHDKARMQDSAVLRQRAKVNLMRDEELSKQLPVRVAIHTGCSDRTLLNEVRALRPDALFVKPFDPTRLVAWLNAARE